ncbi:hypothetical protein ACRBEV_05300 [Methylobacterium phyllosphaerae]
MRVANGNKPLNETEGLVENILDHLMAEAALDEGSDGPLDPRVMLIEMAARAMARTVLNHEVFPQEVQRMALGRLSAILLEALARAEAHLPPQPRVVR